MRAAKTGKKKLDPDGSRAIYSTRADATVSSRWNVVDRPGLAVSRAASRAAANKTKANPAEVLGFAPTRRTKMQKAPTLSAQAVDAVLSLVSNQTGSSRADAIAKLRQAVHHDAIRRPRHAAVALALADTLVCSMPTPGVQQTEALRRAALALLEPYISTADERGVLTSLARAGMERLPPLDEGPLAALLRP